GSGGGGSDDPPALIVISHALSSTGADADAHGNAVYEISSNEREFEVEFEDLADGSYTVSVGGSARASVVTDRGRGRVKFRSPARVDSLPLDFDPRGMLIEISSGGTVYLRGTFPRS
ncbi:MAG: hypothetical protein KA911_04465, partial [Xanthomonadales bacterium]|nr:hypothetical protein [Xanthomonadales bacterium]